MIRHGDRISVTEFLLANRVCFENRGVSLRRTRLHPFKKRRTDVEAQLCVEIVVKLDAAVAAEYACVRHGCIALAFDALVPIMEWRCRWLVLNHACPRIFARRLIEVTMYDNRSH